VDENIVNNQANKGQLTTLQTYPGLIDSLAPSEELHSNYQFSKMPIALR
jgi:hypothetical protein